MIYLEPFLNGSKAPGLWSYSFDQTIDLFDDANTSAIRLVTLHQVTEKQDLFGRLRSPFRLPEWFGDNWDALADWTTEPDWLAETAPTIIVLVGANSIPRPLLATFSDVMQSATRFWASRGRILYVLGDVKHSEGDVFKAFRP